MSDVEGDSQGLEGAEEIEPIDEDEFIDVDSMDFEDNERWLCDYNQCSSESRVHDLYAWLKSDPSSEPQEHPNSLKKSIDTRTFTRAKRRTNRLSFDAIMESLSSPVGNSVETPKVPGRFRMDEVTPNKLQEIPAMLRPKTASLSGLMGNSQPSSMNQESLEVFLNLSQSKGIDSFINLAEPEFADCIMNESQPSLLYSSIISSAADESKRNESLCDMDSGILTESMMQASIFQESLNINSFTEICSRDKESLDNHTHTWDRTKDCLSPLDQTQVYISPSNRTKICISPLETTYINEEESQGDSGMKVNSTEYEHLQETNETSPILHSNRPSQFNESLVSLPADFSDPQFDTSTPEEARFLAHETFESLNAVRINENSMEDAMIDADMTFNVKRLSCQGVPEIPPRNSRENSSSNVTRNINNNNTKVNASSLRQELLEEVVRSGRKMESTFSQEKDQRRDLKMTYENSRQTFSAPLDYYKTYRKEGSRKISIMQSQADFVSEVEDARFQTFRKSPRKEERESVVDAAFLNNEAANVNATFSKNENVGNVNATFSKNEDVGNVNATFSKNEDVGNVNATFSKNEDVGNVNASFSKNEDVGNVNVSFSMNEDLGNVNATFSTNQKPENVNATFSKNEEQEENVNATFCKPQKEIEIQKQQNANSTFSKPQQPRKLTAPKNFSRLPQFLQKSNPNIPTSNALRTIKAPGSFAYPKGSQPNIPRNVGMYTLGKYKSESEQRLLGAIRNSSEQIGNAGGSTESIESTQSAPDLDDRLSVCSDSSRSSYTISTTARTVVRQSDVNSRTIHKFMPQSHKPESTPKPNRQILENTWVQAEKDLPSPILKNNIECPKSNDISSHNDLKLSSPLLSSSSSSENVNSLGVVKNNCREMKPPKVSEKLSIKAPNAPSYRAKSPVDTKPKLRPPTNFNPARPASAASGIPRPASRIPAPKFSRPLSRIQDNKKG